MTRTSLWSGSVAALTGLAILYRFPPETTPFYPPCPIYLLTGLLCPGCGATRALAALLHGQLAQAMHWNALVTLLLPIAIGWMLQTMRRGAFPHISVGKTMVFCGAAMVFFVVRNA